MLVGRMMNRVFHGWTWPLLAAIALSACNAPIATANTSAAEAARTTEASSQKPVPQEHTNTMDDIRDALPADACTQDGYWSFFESFVRSASVRTRYTAEAVSLRSLAQPDLETGRVARQDYSGFRIALNDYQWVLAGTTQDVDLKPTQDGNVFRVDYSPVELGPDDEVVRVTGAPGAYVFEHKNGCWELTQELR